MEPKYKIGDIVTIKKKREGDSDDYRFCFTDTMLKNHGGKSYKITSVSDELGAYDDYPMYDDGHKYYLEGAGFSWASSMFEEDSSEALSLKTSIDNSLDAFIAKKKCPELDFTL